MQGIVEKSLISVYYSYLSCAATKTWVTPIHATNLFAYREALRDRVVLSVLKLYGKYN